MKGTLSKDSIKSIVDPLKAMSSVLDSQTDAVHVIYECEEDAVYIGAVNAAKSAYAMYKLDADKAIDNYTPIKEEIGIWDVQEFIRVIGNYQNSFYKDDVKIDMGKSDVKMNIKCGKDSTEYYTSQLHLIEKGKRALKTDKLTSAVTFTLEGDELDKLRKNIDVFSTLDAVRITGKAGGTELTCKLYATQSSVKTSSNTGIEVDAITEDINIVFPKKEFKGLLACNSKFDITLYVGKKNLGGFSYERDNYEMKFYIAPITEE
jgi:hypothetical protein